MQHLKKDITRFSCNSCIKSEDNLVIEEPLQIMVNSMPFTVTMRTPGNDEELIRGILYTEEIIRDYHADYHIHTVVKYDERYDIENTIANVIVDSKYINIERLGNRSVLSNSSCGICGKRELSDIHISNEILSPSKKLSLKIIYNSFEKLVKLQTLFHKTGGCHAAGGFTIDGECLCVHEDIGRHNAVDKIIGSLIIQKNISLCELLVVSGRISYEIVAKAHRTRISCIAAVSSASAMAVNIAENQGISLIGFCRSDNAVVYTNSDNIQI